MDEKDKKIHVLENDVKALKRAVNLLEKRLRTQETRMSHVHDKARRAQTQIDNMQRRG